MISTLPLPLPIEVNLGIETDGPGGKVNPTNHLADDVQRLTLEHLKPHKRLTYTKGRKLKVRVNESTQLHQRGYSAIG